MKNENEVESRTVMINELLSVIEEPDPYNPTDYLFMCAVVEHIHGQNRYVGQAAEHIKPMLEEIGSLRKKLCAAEHRLRNTLANYKEEWLRGE